jgi:hypothetical protein
MGVNHRMSAAPRNPGLPCRERFTAFLADLIESHVIGFPAYVLAGRDVPGVFEIGTALGQHKRSGGPAPASVKAGGRDLVIGYGGSDPDALLAAVGAVPLGLEDVCVYFISRYYPPNPGLRPQRMIGCDAGVFATLEPRGLVHNEPFDLMAGGWLYGHDPDNPDDDSDSSAQVVRSYPVDPSLPATAHRARWFLELDGKAWDLMAPALPVCARHFGTDHFAGSWVW